MIAKTKKKKTLPTPTVIFLMSLFFIIIFFLIGAILLFSNWQLAKRHKELLLRTEAIEKEISSLEENNERLKTGIASTLEENYLEREAREKFQLAKPGEKVVVVLPSENQTKPILVPEEKTFFEKILEKLGL